MNIGYHGGGHAAKIKRRNQEEEEKLTQYNNEELSGWEFKIVRSAFARFRNQDVLNKVIAEEAQNGWELLEKFDNSRIRFKRRIDKKSLYSGGTIDPYRVNYGISPAVMPFIAMALAILAGLFVFFLDKH